MASVVVVPCVAVAAGVCLAASVPFLALKEILEKRSKKNFKKHLGRRRDCKVYFGDMDAPFVGGINKLKEIKAGSGFVGCAGKVSSPPAYDELFRPPPPYGRK